jgi:hypothetical protein
MRWRKTGERYVLRLDVGDEVISTLTRFVAEQEMGCGSVIGIGGVEKVVLGYFDLDAKQYLRKELSGRFELVSLVGNISTLNGEPFIHAHAVISGPDMTALAGHLLEATVAITGEFYVWGSRERVTRSRDDTVGLNTLDL